MANSTLRFDVGPSRNALVRRRFLPRRSREPRCDRRRRGHDALRRAHRVRRFHAVEGQRRDRRCATTRMSWKETGRVREASRLSPKATLGALGGSRCQQRKRHSGRRL